MPHPSDNWPVLKPEDAERLRVGWDMATHKDMMVMTVASIDDAGVLTFRGTTPMHVYIDELRHEGMLVVNEMYDVGKRIAEQLSEYAIDAGAEHAPRNRHERRVLQAKQRRGR